MGMDVVVKLRAGRPVKSSNQSCQGGGTGEGGGEADKEELGPEGISQLMPDDERRWFES